MKRRTKQDAALVSASSSTSLPEVTRYIENQADHHRRNYLDVELETIELPADMAETDEPVSDVIVRNEFLRA
jgi:hypothetical protein